MKCYICSKKVEVYDDGIWREDIPEDKAYVCKCGKVCCGEHAYTYMYSHLSNAVGCETCVGKFKQERYEKEKL